MTGTLSIQGSGEALQYWLENQYPDLKSIYEGNATINNNSGEIDQNNHPENETDEKAEISQKIPQILITEHNSISNSCSNYTAVEETNMNEEHTHPQKENIETKQKERVTSEIEYSKVVVQGDIQGDITSTIEKVVITEHNRCSNNSRGRNTHSSSNSGSSYMMVGDIDTKEENTSIKKNGHKLSGIRIFRRSII